MLPEICEVVPLTQFDELFAFVSLRPWRNFIAVPSVFNRWSEFEQQLEEMSPWMADVFSLGQPVFQDEALEPVFLDAMGNLAAHDELVPAPMREDPAGNAQPLDLAGTIRTDGIRVPAPRLELGTP